MGLLEGLEISVLTAEQRELDNPFARFDAEYFQKKFLRLPKFPNALGVHALIRSGTTPVDRDDELTEGVALLKTVDIQNRVLLAQNSDSFYKISFEIASRMAKTKLRSRDVLINIVGATTDVVGRVGFIPRDFPEANITQAMALIRTNTNEINPETLFSFLASNYGQLQIQRLARPTGQYNLNLQEVASLQIPSFSALFNNSIQGAIEASLQSARQGQVFLTASEQLLSHKLSIKNWQPPNPLSYPRSSADAFAAGRFDAEHFKPKFAELIAHIENTGNAARLGSLLAVNDRGNQPEYTDTGLPVVNSKHVAHNDVRLDADNRVGLASTAKVLIEPGDVVMNGTGVGTIGRSAPYLHASKAIPDNHVTILRPKNATLDPVYLSVFINSLAGQLQVEQRLHGSSGQIELYPTDIADFTVWLAPKAIQQEIRQAVESGFAAKQHATQLLEAAKRAVEIAIEDSETAALAYLAEFS